MILQLVTQHLLYIPSIGAGAHNKIDRLCSYRTLFHWGETGNAYATKKCQEMMNSMKKMKQGNAVEPGED
jgi:hypothetical protein